MIDIFQETKVFSQNKFLNCNKKGQVPILGGILLILLYIESNRIIRSLRQTSIYLALQIDTQYFCLQKLPTYMTSMLYPPTNAETKFVQIIRNHLEGSAEASLNEIGKKLFPIMSSSNIFASMYNCFHTFYTIRINKGQKFEDGTKIILKYAEEMKDQTVLPKIRDLLDNTQFTSGLESVIQKELNQRKNIISIDKSPKNSNTGPNAGKPPNNISISKKNGKSQNSINNIVDISDDSPTEKQKEIPQKNQGMNTPARIPIHDKQKTPQNHLDNSSMNNLNTDPYEVPNLADKSVCLCGKACALMQPKKDNVFKCYHCNKFYHIECMERGKNMQTQTDPIKKLVSCACCHLKELIPLKQVMKVLFVGVLRQGRKRHGITFNLDMTDLKTKKWRVQVRSFRLKDKIQTFTLFPDSASISINNRFQKQFLPLPKQSSLKYRKDEPFLLTQHLINHENKITIIERIPKKQSKDDRIEPQNHLVGIYLVEDRPIPTIVKEIRVDHVFSFYESKSMLDRCFKIGDAEDITCQVVKIPIICTLTIERIKTPVRGIFCSHYQCFDLNNFLILTSSSANPRWLCPLCKQPAYHFKYDVIVGSIIDEYSKFQPTQIMFTKDGQFKVYSNQDVCPGTITNIQELPIDSKFKRQLQNPSNQEQVMRQAELHSEAQEHKIETETSEHQINEEKSKKPGKNFQFPVDANIISLDDD